MGIRNGRLWIVVVTFSLSKASILSQHRIPITSNQPDLPVGVWEAAQPDGSAVGIDLASVPATVPDAVLPEGTTRKEGSRLQIGVFQKLHQEIVCGEENFFIVGWTGEGASDSLVSYANQKLEIHSHDRVSHVEIHVELVLDPVKDVWTGHFHRGGFDGQVALHRTSDRPDPAEGGCLKNISRNVPRLHIGPLQGTWIVTRIIPTATITCWGKRESQKLIGTHIEYSPRGFRWQDIQTDSPEVILDRLTGEQFHDENSGGGAVDSQVSLKDLGIRTPDVTQISFRHADATISGATNEIPGDRVLIKDLNAIVFSVCNVWFEAKREVPSRTH